MNAACDLCGETTFCRCLEAECRSCGGYGTDDREFDGKCSDCDGTGWIKCDRGGVECRFSHCYCEAAWDAQNERLHTEEPPLSANERHRMAWEQREALRAGRPL